MASLSQKTGNLGERLAAHLLRRGSYKVNYQRIQSYASMSAHDAVEDLFNPRDLLHPDGPINWVNDEPVFDPTDIRGGAFNEGDLIIPLGQIRNAHIKWRIYESMNDESIRWKITHMLSANFVVFENLLRNYPYWRLLYYAAFDSLKSLAYKITLDNNMLLYLNNHQNLKNSPNENYAREFLELFTIMKGEVIETGNYTNYTEADISAAARVLTGFRQHNDGYIDEDTGFMRGYAQFSQHDVGDKQFSSAFGDTLIYGAADAEDMYRELQDFVDMVFDQEETAKAFVRKMYRFFVSERSSQEIEDDIITPLAADLLANDYEIVPVLKKLLKSEHFFDEDDSDATNEIIGGKIKSPYELYFTTAMACELDPHYNEDLELLYKSYATATITQHLDEAGLGSRGPDSVEGFPGRNDAPGYSKYWYTPNFLYVRSTYGLSFKRGRVRNTNTVFPYKADMVAWVENNVDTTGGSGTPLAPEGAADGKLIVESMLMTFLPEIPVGSRYDYFENRLFGDLSPINWYFSWLEYLNTGDDANIRPKIEDLFDAITSSLEYQTF